jgi:hypothetical protein
MDPDRGSGPHGIRLLLQRPVDASEADLPGVFQRIDASQALLDEGEQPLARGQDRDPIPLEVASSQLPGMSDADLPQKFGVLSGFGA